MIPLSPLSRALVALTALVLVPAAPSNAAFSATYRGGGTAVVKNPGEPPAADAGVVQCDRVTGNGVGGACVSFAPPTAAAGVLVKDAAAGTAVAFQVCIDNNGDGLCTSPDFGQCADDIFFSHDDFGNFFNPLGPLPTSFKFGCPGGAWKGYVVLLCEGVHGGGGDGTTAKDPHVHPATTGTVNVVPGGTGFGTFCGGARQNPSRKAYIVV